MTPKLSDTVTLVSRLLFDDDIRREGIVVAVGEDGLITAEFPQAGTSPMRVTTSPEHFTVVHRAPAVAEQERQRQAAYLYSIIQSAENSEDGAAETDVQRAYDQGILYAARAVLENWASDSDWTTLSGAVPEGWEYAEEIRNRVVPGSPLPNAEREVFEAAITWCEAQRGWFLDDPDRRATPEDLALIAAVDALEDDQA